MVEVVAMVAVGVTAICKSQCTNQCWSLRGLTLHAWQCTMHSGDALVVVEMAVIRGIDVVILGSGVICASVMAGSSLSWHWWWWRWQLSLDKSRTREGYHCCCW